MEYVGRGLYWPLSLSLSHTLFLLLCFFSLFFLSSHYYYHFLYLGFVVVFLGRQAGAHTFSHERTIERMNS
ncbi:hypothetical protein QBC38DRAFT_481019 [Podospora fimiseda]|uniref:Uncharacterized protein n=1 Tax=Podospora fimiseda TaxID=252190 RepID=A0AAN7BMP3_9PEZI|nr:hypothetical protein QBC38DRAFT_481019 [Podospora fimiseda]